MLANVKTIKQFVKKTVDMRGDGYNRRIWQDKNKKDNTLRNLAFRFARQADAVKLKDELEFYLFAMGYNNKVTFNSTYDKQRDIFDRRVDSYYVRVIAAQ